MTIAFEHAEIETLLSELERETGRARSDLLLEALKRERDRLDRQRARDDAIASAQLLRERTLARPLIGPRPVEEILGYDEGGRPI